MRRQWPLVALLVGIVLVQLAFNAAYDVSGHALEHLTVGGIMGLIGAGIIGVILWTTPTARRQPEVLVALGLWLVMCVLLQVGNLRVVNDLVDAGLGRAPTEGLPDVADHRLANAAPWWGMVAALGVGLLMWRRRHISGRVLLVTAALDIVVLPFIYPGAGMFAIVAARCNARQS